MISICYYVIKYVRKTKKIDESHQTLFRVREGLGRDYRNVYTVYVRVPGTTGKPSRNIQPHVSACACMLLEGAGHQIA